jgi:uncharacterized protein (UPF0332 family)
MKELDFLKILYRKKNIQLVEPSKKLTNSYLSKSQSYLDSGKLLLKFKKYEESVSIFYYSMYYSLLALLFKVGVKSENHFGSICMLKFFGREDLFRVILNAKKERVDKQYYVDFKVTEKELVVFLESAEEFVLGCKELIDNFNDVVALRKKIMSAIL